MKYRRLGRTALNVSELCLGTMNFGPRTPERASFAILDAAVDAGINFIDTANQYGGHLGVGTTETLLGKWLAKHPDKRQRLVIATKVHEPTTSMTAACQPGTYRWPARRAWSVFVLIISSSTRCTTLTVPHR